MASEALWGFALVADGTDLWAVLLREKWCYAHSEQHLKVKTVLSSDRQTPNSSVCPLSRTSHCYSTLAGKKMCPSHIILSFHHLPYSFHLMMTHTFTGPRTPRSPRASCLRCRSLGLWATSRSCWFLGLSSTRIKQFKTHQDQCPDKSLPSSKCSRWHAQEWLPAVKWQFSVTVNNASAHVFHSCLYWVNLRNNETCGEHLNFLL